MRRFQILVGCLALVAAACGGGSDGADDATTAATGSGSGSGNAVNGETLYQQTCASCHGPDAGGLPNLGRPLAASDFIGGMSDQELVDFIVVGRAADDPDNEAGVAMPPRGGNPALTDGDLLDIVTYLRTLQ